VFLRSVFATIAVAGGLFGAAIPALAQKVEISALSFVPKNNSFAIPFNEWIQAINADPKAPISINYKEAGTMSPFDMGEAVKNGVIDLVLLPAAFYTNSIPIADFLKLAETPPSVWKQNGGWEWMQQLHREKMNVEMLTVFGYGVPFHLYMRSKPVETADLKGLKLRVTPVYRAFFGALGADLIQTKPQDVYTSLERGVVDGYGWPLWDLRSLGWDKVTKYRVEPGFYQTMCQVLMNKSKLDKLTKEQQAYIRAQGDVLLAKHEAELGMRAKLYEKEQADAGIQVVTLKGAEREKFLKVAYEAGWAEAEKLVPGDAQKLKSFITKK
jgi:TRAP-type C4-dicarboxylate transport system substrate-binding protein